MFSASNSRAFRNALVPTTLRAATTVTAIRRPDGIENVATENARQVFEEQVVFRNDAVRVHTRVLRSAWITGLVAVGLYIQGEERSDADVDETVVRGSVTGARTAVVFVWRQRSSEQGGTVEQACAAVRWITAKSAESGWDASRLAIVGDSIYRTVADAMLADDDGSDSFLCQSLYLRSHHDGQDTEDREALLDGPYLTGKAMAWFGAHYLPAPWRFVEQSEAPRLDQAQTSRARWNQTLAR